MNLSDPCRNEDLPVIVNKIFIFICGCWKSGPSLLLSALKKGAHMLIYFFTIVSIIFAQATDLEVCADVESNGRAKITRIGQDLVWSTEASAITKNDGNEVRTVDIKRCRITVSSSETQLRERLTLDSDQRLVADRVKECFGRHKFNPSLHHAKQAQTLMTKLSRCITDVHGEKLLLSNGYEFSVLPQSSPQVDFYKFLGVERGGQEFAFYIQFLPTANLAAYEKFKFDWNSNRSRKIPKNSSLIERQKFWDEQNAETSRLNRVFLDLVNPVSAKIILDIDDRNRELKVFTVVWQDLAETRRGQQSVRFWERDGLVNSLPLRPDFHGFVTY